MIVTCFSIGNGWYCDILHPQGGSWLASTERKAVSLPDWLRPLNYLEFLRDVGKCFTVNYMLAKEAVKRRIEQEDGVSYTEFSYLMLQSYDYLTLFDRYGCTLQMGGSDQWGNITAGADLIRRLRGAKAHGLVMPLVTTSSGVKFGKTEAGAVWLDPQLTSPFRFYQFWLNTDDRDVINYLKFFTFLDRETITELEQATVQHPEQRSAQRKLAREITGLLHGETALSKAEQAAQVLFGGEISGLSAAEIEDIFADVPSSTLPLTALEGAGQPALDVFVGSGLVKSKGEARRAVADLVPVGGVVTNLSDVAQLYLYYRDNSTGSLSANQPRRVSLAGPTRNKPPPAATRPSRQSDPLLP